MRFLADENFPRDAIEALRSAGFDLAWASEDQARAPDQEVLGRCMREGRTLLTLDKDFGQLVFQHGLSAGCGVVLFRVNAESEEEFCRIALAALGSGQEWTGHFAVVSRDRIRMTPLGS